MFAGACTLLVMFGVPETYREYLDLTLFSLYSRVAPKILADKAKRLRQETGVQRWYAPRECPVKRSSGDPG
jgi:hypothetical protein